VLLVVTTFALVFAFCTRATRAAGTDSPTEGSPETAALRSLLLCESTVVRRKITIYFSGTAPAGTKVAWFVFG